MSYVISGIINFWYYIYRINEYIVNWLSFFWCYYFIICIKFLSYTIYNELGI